MKNQQTKFWSDPLKTHGGEIRAGKGKVARPVATKRPMHIVIKSARAKGVWSFLHRKNKNRVDDCLKKTAKHFHIKVYRFANVGNHCHFLIQGRRREDIQNFLRVLSQKIMFLVTGAQKGNPIGKFWEGLAFSRIVEWGRDWQQVLNYLEKNYFEGKGVPRDVVDWSFAQMAGG